ncbi:DDE_3 domain-containing protein [Trichonephila inaurata madagascariensis]|uniref:DDE_3 domain-containing protein n=1 Tax=Trichonephila inaurata madagascariensis TaxID=2747483 RepID=A0A8X6XXN5_9ARAC|nr:DDE_3 domain-containing protein [Trichonephila inaurata madagascariensis]GFY62216.1 DDE_3 domain-containing protein [Trichonephila inaurata madagascariensis]
MDGNPFEKWFKTAMTKLKSQNIIVIDNAPYYSVKKENIPTRSWKKSAIQEWLSEKKVTWNQDGIKIELLQKVSPIEAEESFDEIEELETDDKLFFALQPQVLRSGINFLPETEQESSDSSNE